MAEPQKRLAFAIIEFLQEQLQHGGLSPDAQESLEVAIQCLETAFGVSVEDRGLAISQKLPDIFEAAAAKEPLQSCPIAEPASPSEEDAAEAERLKTEGNEQMKVENFQSAISFYGRAIELNPANAVYYCNRAAAYSKLGNYAGAVRDCERAINIDPKYSKAYGRMGLALSSLNKLSEAIFYYQKALELDPENETYKSNLKVTEQKMKEAPSPTGGAGGFDLAGLLNNPGFMSMASNLMNNPQVQQLGPVPGESTSHPGVGLFTNPFQSRGWDPAGVSLPGNVTHTEGHGSPPPLGRMSGMISSSQSPVAAPGASTAPHDLASLIQAGQQFAQQMQQQNPELIEQLRSQIRSRTPSASNEEQQE